MSKRIVVLSVAFLISINSVATAERIRWDVADGGNGHSYEAMLAPKLPTGLQGTITWPGAMASAVARGGYLATITSAEENQFVFSLIDSRPYWGFDGIAGFFGPWLGAWQEPEAENPAADWHWITGEPFDYANWHVGEPNDMFGNEEEDHLLFFAADGTTGPRSAFWNDEDGQRLVAIAYVVEYVPEPAAVLLFLAGLALASLCRRSKNRLALSFIVAVAAVSLSSEYASAQDVNLPGWRLVWQDEFDLPTIDTSKWEVLTRQNSYNAEKQYYLPQQASIVDGNLRITATNQPIANKQYRSARLESWQAFGPGRFEARIDLPTGQGMWPAFWLFPNDPSIPWPTGGEIDILENRGSQPELVSSAYHWQASPGPCCDNAHYVFGEYIAFGELGLVDFHQGFHVYAAEWEEDEIRFFVDGELSFAVVETASLPVFETPKNIILNLAVGGLFGGDPDLTTEFPQVMDIDYVRVWEAVPEPATQTLSLLSIWLVLVSGRSRSTDPGGREHVTTRLSTGGTP